MARSNLHQGWTYIHRPTDRRDSLLYTSHTFPPPVMRAWIIIEPAPILHRPPRPSSGDRAKRSLSISCSPRAFLRFHRSRGNREILPSRHLRNWKYIYIEGGEGEKKYISLRGKEEGLISILSGQFGKEPRIIGPENVGRLSLRRGRVCGRCIRTVHVSIIVIRRLGRRGKEYGCVLFGPGADNRVVRPVRLKCGTGIVENEGNSLFNV